MKHVRMPAFSAMLGAIVLGILAIGPASAAPPPFDPGGVMCFESLESAANCDGDTAPGAAADLRLTFCTGWNADCTTRDNVVNSSSVADMVMFTPAEWTVPKGDTLPLGTIAGRIDKEAFVSLLNNPCNARIGVAWTLLNASVNVADTIAPKPEGETDVMQPLAIDANGNGIPDGADKYPSFLAESYSIGGVPMQPRARLFGITNIQHTWYAQNILFFEPGQTLEIGQTVVTFSPGLGYPAVAVLQDPTAQDAPGAITDDCAPVLSDLVVLGRTLDNPCTPTSVQGANCPVTTDEGPDIRERGYPSLPCEAQSTFDDDGDGMINDGCPQVNAVPETGAECNNDVSDDAEDSSVNDGCPPVGDVSEGSRIPGGCTAADEGGCNHRENPASAGTQTFTVLAMSGRDADGDGIENELDTCVYDFNPDWNPRAVDPAIDPDMDGLPTECDPKPNETSPGSPIGCASGYTGADDDQDCFSNRQDNCPTDASLEDPAKPPDPATNKPYAPDDDHDGIGNACDANPNAVDGENTGYCLKFPLDVGGAGGPVVGIRDPGRAPDCVATSCNVVPCGTVQPFTILTCSVNDPVIPPNPTPAELATVTSDVTVYAIVRTFYPIFRLSVPPTGPIIFSDEPGLGAVAQTAVTAGTGGIAQTTYRFPAGLTGMAVATVTATTADGRTCSVSFILKPGITAFPPTGGSDNGGSAGVLQALAGAAIALAGAAAMAWARLRRAAFSTAGAAGVQPGRYTGSGVIIAVGLIAVVAAAAFAGRRRG